MGYPVIVGGVDIVSKYLYMLTAATTVGVMAVAPALATVMKMTQTTFALPEEGEVVELSGLHYGIRFSADVTTAVYETKAGKDEGQMIVVWTFTGSNTAGKMHRVDVAVWLLNEIGERVAHGVGKATLGSGAKEQKFKVKVKTTREDLEKTTLVNVQANWVS
jgi:hypothetical protein